MDNDIICEFYDYLLRSIGAESRYMLYDHIYENAQAKYADRLFPDDDERHYNFMSFFELQIGRMEKEHGFISVKYKNEKPIEIGLSEVGEYVFSLGGYLQYKKEQESVQKRIEEDKRQIMLEESNERKWNIRNNIVQIILGIVTIMSIIGQWVYAKDGNILFTISTFIAGGLLGYGVNNLINKLRYYKNKNHL